MTGNRDLQVLGQGIGFPKRNDNERSQLVYL